MLICWCVECWCVDALMRWCVGVLICCCADVLWLMWCWCVNADADVLMCGCADVLMLMCWRLVLVTCVDVSTCVDVLWTALPTATLFWQIACRTTVLGGSKRLPTDSRYCARRSFFGSTDLQKWVLSCRALGIVDPLAGWSGGTKLPEDLLTRKPLK
jgi:hypothetical protein